MIRSLEESGEIVGIEVKSVILYGFFVISCLEEVLVLYVVFKKEYFLLYLYVVGLFLVGEIFFFYCFFG